MAHFTYQKNLLTVYSHYQYGYVWILNVLFELRSNFIRKLHWGLPCGRKVSNQNEGNHAIGSDRDGPGKRRFLPDSDLQRVLSSNDVMRVVYTCRAGRI